MTASDARIRANQVNSQRSTGPRTPEGKERSRANALKHGLTGGGIVLPEADAAEVERRVVAFAQELNASGEIGQALVRRAALNSVRMERAADQQTAALSERVRQVEADFVAPGGVDDAEAVRLRAEACRQAMFDSSKEATLARKYEASAERGFFRAIKELRQSQKPAKGLGPAAQAEVFRQELGSFLSHGAMDEEADAMFAMYEAEEPSAADSARKRGGPSSPSPRSSATGASSDLPFAIGGPRQPLAQGRADLPRSG